MINHSYNEKIDIWACGVILYVLLCGYPPFHGGSEQADTLASILSDPLIFDKRDWFNITEPAKDLIKQMLDRDPTKRVDAKTALAHPWFKSIKAPTITRQRGKALIQKLQKFHKKERLQDAIWSFMTNFLLTNQELQILLNEFKAIDSDKDGQLSRDEIAECY
mmetsp:Transcript_39732/g.35459  ORF Transcript_39732/g.35459 Transcript_39732/m.35459 type:complete len:163 (-) Transcript_39732:27-515(-)